MTDKKSKKSRKKHIILPNSITIQLKDLNGNNIEIENILFHLNIFSESGGYYTFSFIPTNTKGNLTLTKKQIIANTELKHHYDSSLILQKRPVKFEIFIMESKFLFNLIKGIGNYLATPIESTKKFLQGKGFSVAQINNEIPKVSKKMEEDRILYEFLKLNNNDKLKSPSDKYKITGFWEFEGDFKYEISIDE